MSRRWLLAFALLAVPAIGQDDAKAAKKAYDALVAEYTAAMDTYVAAMREVTATEEYKDLREKLSDRDLDASVRQELIEKLNALRTSVPSVDRKAFTARFQGMAEKYADTEGAVPFLTWIFINGDGNDSRAQALETIVASHAKSGQIREIMRYLPYATRAMPVEKVRVAATTFAEKNPEPDIKAAALYARAQTYLGDGRPRKPLAGFEEAYEKDLAKAVETAPDSITTMSIKGPAFEKERLQIGMAVPDIEGRDLDGTSFKLSDYRGKVVVLDFWGYW